MKTDNELIAEFMGWQCDVINDIKIWYQPGVSSPGTLKFDTSWDWLMPVVEKIQFFAQVKIENSQCIISVNGTCITWPHSGTNIQNVYKAVVEFIKWYNSQKK